MTEYRKLFGEPAYVIALFVASARSLIEEVIRKKGLKVFNLAGMSRRLYREVRIIRLWTPAGAETGTRIRKTRQIGRAAYFSSLTRSVAKIIFPPASKYFLQHNLSTRAHASAY